MNDSRATLLTLKLATVDSDKNSCVEINGETEKWFNITTITISMSFNASEKDSKRHFMASFRL